jgi:segregation and condensation protein B
MTLEQKIIQILLFEGGALKKAEIAKILNCTPTEVNESVLEIRNLLAILNLKLLQTETSLEIVLSDEINSLINKNKIEELKTELSESSLQTLGVIIYKNKSTKAEIDFIRGVDSGRSIKNLLTRGIIEKVEEKNRKNYIVSSETLKYLGLEEVTEVPDFTEISAKLKTLIEGE